MGGVCFVGGVADDRGLGFPGLILVVGTVSVSMTWFSWTTVLPLSFWVERCGRTVSGCAEAPDGDGRG